jgi:uncharacterized damage-inducible protein DinB
MKITSSAIGILEQLRILVLQLDDSDLQLPLEVFSGSSIGQHTRHILEFYICLLTQISEEVISYDKRERDTKLEQKKEYILSKIEGIMKDLATQTKDSTLTLHSELCKETHLTPSSLSREILYTIEHTVHHMAIIKIGILLNFPKISMKKNFGVAESTIRYIARNN